MKILAVESSAVAASVALCEDECLLAETTVNSGNTHSETLLPTVENLLSRLRLTVGDIDLFAVAAGPGSFTGVRIGVATIKGLAFRSGKPCVGVSALEALAENLAHLSGALVCPVMNARREQIYTALFRADRGILTRLLPDTAISIAEWNTVLAGYGNEIYFCGDGYSLMAAAYPGTVMPVPHRLQLQSAASVASVALRMFRGGQAVPDSELSPIYLRPSQAERVRAEKESGKASRS